MTPAWILDMFAALMLVVAAVSAARLVAAPAVAARPWRLVQADTDVDGAPADGHRHGGHAAPPA